MKTIAYILFLFIVNNTLGNQLRIDEILLKSEISTPKYIQGIEGAHQLFLEMDFGKASIVNASEISAINGSTILQVDLVFSNYPENINLLALNKKRLKNLYVLDSTLFLKKSILWNFVRQTECANEMEAKKLFHGIVITYRPFEKYSSTKGFDYFENLFDQYSTGKNKLSDSTIIKVLNRNKWTNMTITTDLTGSMAPYVVQLLLWYKMNTTDKNVKLITFFNDGDNKPESQKFIGKIGGVYSIKAKNFDEIKNLAKKVMSNGNGGDSPENDLEALIHSINACPTCQNNILIADNWSNIKDYSLMKYVNKPVKIILCGAFLGVNTQYLDLAKATGGSIHTMEEDLTELATLNEGEIIKILGKKYIIEKGKFKMM
jgi:hypothetical protein